MPGSAPTYKRECNALRTQTDGTRRSPGDSAVVSSPRHSNGPIAPLISAATSVAGCSALCRLRDHSYVVGSTQHAPGHSVEATGSHGRRGLRTTAGNAREISEGPAFSSPSRGDHDHKRIRGAVSAPSAITPSNLHGGSG